MTLRNELYQFFNHGTLPGIKAHEKLSPPNRFISTSESELRKAAVAVLVYPVVNNWEIALIKRPEYNGPHSSQVSFPGGKYENIDQSLLETARRECFEEIGFKPPIESFVGELSSIPISVSQYQVYPFVFVVEFKPEFYPDKIEVNYIVACPIRDLTKKENLKSKIIKIKNEEILVPYYQIKDEMIWGATAIILSEFSDIITALEINITY